jgi:phosphoribosylglycinamide formyltransferase 2
VILSDSEGVDPTYSGIEKVLTTVKTDIRIFSKPTTRKYRRMGVVLAYDKIGGDVDIVKQKAIDLAKNVKVHVS